MAALHQLQKMQRHVLRSSEGTVDDGSPSCSPTCTWRWKKRFAMEEMGGILDRKCGPQSQAKVFYMIPLYTGMYSNNLQNLVDHHVRSLRVVVEDFRHQAYFFSMLQTDHLAFLVCQKNPCGIIVGHITSIANWLPYMKADPLPIMRWAWLQLRDRQHPGCCKETNTTEIHKWYHLHLPTHVLTQHDTAKSHYAAQRRSGFCLRRRSLWQRPD